MMEDAVLFSALYIGIGIFSLILGLKEYLRWRFLKLRGVKAKGVARTVTDSDDNVTLTASFVAEGGISYTVRSRGGDTAWKDLDGRQVEILYLRGKPETARLVADLKLRTGLAVYWFGFLFAGIGLLVLVLHYFGIEVLSRD